MKELEKKVVALFAALTALVAFVGFGTANAMADDSYGAKVTVSGTTATGTITFDPQDIEKYGEYVYIEADSELVAQVVPAASIENAEYYYAGHVTKEAPVVNFTIKLKQDATCKATVLNYNVHLGKNQVSGANNGELTDAQVASADLSPVLPQYSGSVNVPATGSCQTAGTTTGAKTEGTAKTGASVFAYGIAAVLLAFAAVAMLVVRKQQRH
ncbi:hypothetical protein [Bifidobacterium leontopitheci]|uniref:Uncharacterized protein n=1 Tax=Bifidobacterium leontopitheci TaxID=2650774 RepID=A0A6I1GFX1_9BIFI|nr:hypothetical protein [Bifidobacterium leontopitheci]KAB7790455.1 hypothetical protein F7D09_1051 [Bifidobacterium leontopitheci]